MADLVALLEVDLGRLRREGKPEDGGDERPANGYQEVAGSYEPILIRGQDRIFSVSLRRSGPDPEVRTASTGSGSWTAA
jgi:hypothetical protein